MKRKHLPLYGVGPLYVTAIAVLTAAGVLASHLGLLDSGKFPVIRLPLAILGALFILGGVALWRAAVLRDKISEGIVQNRLVTTGVYSVVRNPIYTAFLLACTGALLLANNLWLLLLPPAYWLFLTLLMRATEEKWLKEQYGREYEDYCKRVNRCLPWFPERRDEE